MIQRHTCSDDIHRDSDRTIHSPMPMPRRARVLDIYPLRGKSGRGDEYRAFEGRKEGGNNGESSNGQRESVLDKACRSVGRTVDGKKVRGKKR